ncbi:MAG TPA: cupin domain-containing protein [Stellaceae bacterium]|nr:cupin domain-containing protein [Stellaceae bacterium]
MKSPQTLIRRGYRLGPVALAAMLGLAAGTGMGAAAEPTGVALTTLVQRALPDLPGKTLTAVVVRLAPGTVVPAHHHAGFVFAYVLSGTVRSQLNRGAVVDYRTGQSWLEPPGTEHTLTANPSRTEPARLLAVFVAPTGAKLTTFGR